MRTSKNSSNAASTSGSISELAPLDSNAQSQVLAPLPDPSSSWALITGATSGLAQSLAERCVRAGYGVILADHDATLALDSLAVGLRKLESSGKARVITVPTDLLDPSESARLLHERVRPYDVAVLLVASDQFSYTGPFLSQPPANLDRMLALNVGATCALCRYFGQDMEAAGRGRILLVGAPRSSRLGVAGACAFAGTMAFVRALVDGLRQELAPAVGVSCLESRGVGREESLNEALMSTCVSFLACDEVVEKNGNLAEQRVLEAAPGQGLPTNRTSPAEEESSWLPYGFSQAYEQLARERGFQVLPLGAEIDALQRSTPAEFSNAMLVGFACLTYALKTLPWISLQTYTVLNQITAIGNTLFALDYVARWWSRGLRWDYLLTPTMISDLLSVLPFLLRGVVPGMQGVELNFLKLFRVLRIYRFFRPNEVKSAIRLLLGPGLADEADTLMKQIRPYQLQVARTFGIVFTLVFVNAGLMYEAEHRANPQFSDFFASFYFGIISLSTVGFGDIAPVTDAGKVIACVSIIVSLCVIPYQASLVASAVAEEQLRLEERETGDLQGMVSAEALLTILEQSRTEMAWDAARIAELEGREQAAQEQMLEEKLAKDRAQLEVKIQRAKSAKSWV